MRLFDIDQKSLLGRKSNRLKTRWYKGPCVENAIVRMHLGIKEGKTEQNVEPNPLTNENQIFPKCPYQYHRDD